MSFLTELLAFLRTRKKLWLIPVLLTMALLAALIFISGNPTLAPFIYTLF